MRFLLLLCCLLWLVPAAAVKPRVPVVLDWERLADDGETLRLGLEADSALEGIQVQVVLRLPPGARLLQGEGRWQGTLTRGRQRLFEVVLQGGRGLLRATAELTGPAAQRAEAVYPVGGVVPLGVSGIRGKSSAGQWSLHGRRGVWEFRMEAP